MADYKKMYHTMFNASTDAERLIEKAAEIMKAAQVECEQIFVEADETPIDLTDKLTE